MEALNGLDEESRREDRWPLLVGGKPGHVIPRQGKKCIAARKRPLTLRLPSMKLYGEMHRKAESLKLPAD